MNKSKENTLLIFKDLGSEAYKEAKHKLKGK